MNQIPLSLSLCFLLVLAPSITSLAQGKYQTFDFLDLDVELLTEHQINQENADYLKTAIARELTAKGLEQSSNPDLAVNIGVVVEEEVQTRETDIRDMRYMGQRNYHWEVEEVVVGVYKVGTVSVELVDTKANRAVWEESESNVINKKQKNVQKKIDKGVSRIFKKFDPATL
jgi:hypothetical protein